MIEGIQEGLPEQGGSHQGLIHQGRGWGPIAKAWRLDFAVDVPE